MDSLTASRRDAVARLCQAQVDGLLSVETFQERYAMIQEAGTRSALEALVADLGVRDAMPVPLAGTAPAPAPAADPLTPLPAMAGPVRIPSIMGSATRAGEWIVPDHLELLVILGQARLDFREALFQADTVVVDLSLTFGSLEVIVPPGTRVVNECREILSSSSHPRPGGRPAESNGIMIVLQGRLLMGELKIRERGIGASTGLAARLGFGHFD